MPTYQYACTSCGEELEAVQKFTDEPLTVCPKCSGPLRKVFSAVGVVFKGSGFYKTDSRAKSASKTGSPEAGKPDGGKPDGGKSGEAAQPAKDGPAKDGGAKDGGAGAPSAGSSSSSAGSGSDGGGSGKGSGPATGASGDRVA
jgi:putative FmdB family regulatory protein